MSLIHIYAYFFSMIYSVFFSANLLSNSVILPSYLPEQLLNPSIKFMILPLVLNFFSRSSFYDKFIYFDIQFFSFLFISLWEFRLLLSSRVSEVFTPCRSEWRPTGKWRQSLFLLHTPFPVWETINREAFYIRILPHKRCLWQKWESLKNHSHQRLSLQKAMCLGTSQTTGLISQETGTWSWNI